MRTDKKKTINYNYFRGKRGKGRNRKEGGRKGVEVAHVPGGGEKEKRELPRDSQQPPIVAGRMTQRGRYRKGGGGKVEKRN